MHIHTHTYTHINTIFIIFPSFRFSTCSFSPLPFFLTVNKRATRILNEKAQYVADRAVREKQYQAASTNAASQRRQKRQAARAYSQSITQEQRNLSLAQAALSDKALLTKGRKRLRNIARTLISRSQTPESYSPPEWYTTPFMNIMISPHNVREIELTPSHLKKYVLEGPRHYTSVLIFTAEPMYKGCELCGRSEAVYSFIKDAYWDKTQHSWAALAKATVDEMAELVPPPAPFFDPSVRGGVAFATKDLPVVFFSVPVEQHREFFRSNGINSAPMIMVVPPELGEVKYAPETFFKDAGIQPLSRTVFGKPDDLRGAIEKYTKIAVPEGRPYSNFHAKTTTMDTEIGHEEHSEQNLKTRSLGFSLAELEKTPKLKSDEHIRKILESFAEKIPLWAFVAMGVTVLVIVYLSLFHRHLLWVFFGFLKYFLAFCTLAVYIFSSAGGMFNRTSESTVRFSSPRFNPDTFGIWQAITQPETWAHDGFREQYHMETILVAASYVMITFAALVVAYLPYHQIPAKVTKDVAKETDQTKKMACLDDISNVHFSPLSHEMAKPPQQKCSIYRLLFDIIWYAVFQLALPLVAFGCLCILYMGFVKLFTMKMPSYQTDVLWTHGIVAYVINTVLTRLSIPYQVPRTLFL